MTGCESEKLNRGEDDIFRRRLMDSHFYAGIYIPAHLEELTPRVERAEAGSQTVVKFKTAKVFYVCFAKCLFRVND